MQELLIIQVHSDQTNILESVLFRFSSKFGYNRHHSSLSQLFSQNQKLSNQKGNITTLASKQEILQLQHLIATMAVRTTHMETEKTFVLGVSENTSSSKESQVNVGSPTVASPIGRVDLLDLLDEQFLPKDRVKNHGRRHISILDVMPSPETVKERIEAAKKKDAEARQKNKSMDLVDFLDKRTYLQKKDENDIEVPPQRISVLDVMDPPPSVLASQPKKPVDLVSLLDEKTRLPRDTRGDTGRRRISLLDILEKQRLQRQQQQGK